jgi:hypothetical protein
VLILNSVSSECSNYLILNAVSHIECIHTFHVRNEEQ